MIEGFQIDLLDKTGDRKFVKTKADTMANTFLSDKNTYFLATIVNTEGYIIIIIEIIYMIIAD